MRVGTHLAGCVIIADDGVRCCTLLRCAIQAAGNLACGETLGAVVLGCSDGGDDSILCQTV